MSSKNVSQICITHKPDSEESIEDILCLAVLIAADKLPENSTLEDSEFFHNSLKYGCVDCPFVNKCLACIINE